MCTPSGKTTPPGPAQSSKPLRERAGAAAPETCGSAASPRAYLREIAEGGSDPASIDEDDPAFGWKWAWNYRYRYLGSGFRGPFRIIHSERRGRRTARLEGRFFLPRVHGYPGARELASCVRFPAGRYSSGPAAATGPRAR